MKTYKTVQDFCDQNIPIEYHGWFMGYGENVRTDVETWIDETFFNPELVKKQSGVTS